MLYLQAHVLSAMVSTFSILYRIFATPSVILRSSGSVGLSLVMWLLGASVALCGTAVYMELGTVSGSGMLCADSALTIRYLVPGAAS